MYKSLRQAKITLILKMIVSVHIHTYIYIIFVITSFIAYFVRKNGGNPDDNLIEIKKKQEC